MGQICTTCKGNKRKEIRVQVHFGLFAPGICDDCLDEMMKIVMSHISGGYLPRPIMEKKDV